MALRFNREFEPRHGEAVVIADRVRRVTAPNPGPFTFHGTNSFLIGERELAVLDPGPADPAHIEKLIQATGGVAVRHILVSHAHQDHAPGTRLLQAKTGAPILAAGIRRQHHAPLPDAAPRIDSGVDDGFQPDEMLADGALVEGPDYRLEVVATPGHAADHLAFALEGEGILFSGDHVMGWATTMVAPPDGSMSDYIGSLDKLLARPESLYFPAHGGPVREAHAYVRALRTHRKLRETSILKRLQDGDRTIAEIVARIYADLDPRLAGAAALSTLAHLEDLVARRLVETDGPADLAGRYRPAVASG